MDDPKSRSVEHPTYIFRVGVNKPVPRMAGNLLQNYTVSQSKNVKAKLPLSMAWRYIRGVEVYIHQFLASALEGKWSTSFLVRSTPGMEPLLNTGWAPELVGKFWRIENPFKRQYHDC